MKVLGSVSVVADTTRQHHPCVEKASVMYSQNSFGAAPAVPAGFVVSEHWIGRVVVFTASGDLDMLTAPTLAAAITAAARHRPDALIVDLAAVGFLASAGMNLLVNAQEDLAPATRFGVVADGPATSRPLKVIGIDTIIALYRTLEDAVNDLA